MVSFLSVGLGLLYPFAVYFALQKERLELALLALVPIALLHLVRGWRGVVNGWVLSLACLALIVWGGLSGSAVGAKLYPVFVNLGLLSVFGWTLVRPPSLIERLARLKDPVLPPLAVAYTRRVTIVWCVFFIFNGAVALVTVFTSDQVWFLYNGIISYALMGALFLGEWVCRRIIQRHEHD